ncbi:hypothetical protein [Streptosporangium sp. NPDC048865]|uniref:hypothetical protein n=1 Tax=Streptosporangium sp. NPDC048865 TaxID=3155766 RepID=UPI00342E5B8D
MVFHLYAPALDAAQSITGDTGGTGHGLRPEAGKLSLKYLEPPGENSPGGPARPALRPAQAAWILFAVASADTAEARGANALPAHLEVFPVPGVWRPAPCWVPIAVAVVTLAVTA